MNKSIEIHEFSTGIVVKKDSHGNWFSGGFTGRYMNQTIESIPYGIQEAISNRLFTIAEGASSDIPALIGREVESNGEIWSVVAVVNKAIDESRSFSAYRYFCIEGKGNLNKILRFLTNNPLKFNPLDKQSMGNPHQVAKDNDTKIPLDNFQDLLSDSIPIIIPSDRTCSPIIINSLVEEIAKDDLIAWAFNVKALEKPTAFYIIKPSDEKAEAIIRKNLSNQIIGNKPIVEEEKIKKSVIALCKKNKIEGKYIKTIEEALNNSNINDQFWQSIFDGQGLKTAKSQGIYNDEMTRLFTLKTLILPKTLPEFLTWINKTQKEDFLEKSTNFQSEILKVLTREFSSKYLIEKIEMGVILIIPSLLKNPDSVNEVVTLLKSEKSLWGYYYTNQISKDIDSDLKLMTNYVTDKNQEYNFQIMEEESWLKIRDELTIAWGKKTEGKKRFKPITKYQILVELFKQLKNYKLAVFFAHIAYDTVPKSIFSKVVKPISFGTNIHHEIYGINVTREIGSVEQILLTLKKLLDKEIDMKLWMVIFLIITFGLTGFTARVFLFQSKLEKAANKFIEKQTESIKDKEELKIKKAEITENIEKAFNDENNNLMNKAIECYAKKQKCEITTKPE